MKEENVTFSGIEAKTLTAEDIRKAINLIKELPKDFTVSIGHNCDREYLLKKLNAFEVKENSETYLSAYFGIPLVKKSYIPQGEVWMVNNEGKVTNKFKL